MSFDKLRYKILTDPSIISKSQAEDALLILKRKAARGEVEIDPCPRCKNPSYELDDGDLRCDYCGLVYEEDWEDE